MSYVAPDYDLSAWKLKQPVHINVPEWLEENSKHFLPPVCNKMMHNTQLKVFYVGGPNQRKDYHLEEGEELFYMRKGQMCLKIQEGGEFRDIIIKEGQVFLLPGRIPHSPNRWENTVGLVVERLRMLDETDGLRYFVGDSDSSLFEKWFYCENLGTQLGPIIKQFFASKQCETGKPIPEELPETVPWNPDRNRRVEEPFDLKARLEQRLPEIMKRGSVRLFDDSYQSDVLLLGKGPGKRKRSSDGGETFLWQLRGEAKIRLNGETFGLRLDDTLLIPENSDFDFEVINDDSVTLSCLMDPTNKKRIPPQSN